MLAGAEIASVFLFICDYFRVSNMYKGRGLEMLEGQASITAKICAFARAHHGKYMDNPIYEDEFAMELLGQKDYEDIKDHVIRILSNRCWSIPTRDTWDHFINELVTPIVVPRIKYTEEKLDEFYEEDKELIQYVICGAGLDSFMFKHKSRMANIEVFELDHKDTQAYKLSRIHEIGWELPVNAHLVSIDFEKDSIKEVLLNAGFDPKKKAFFVILGVTYYLSLETFTETLKAISDLAEGECQIVFDYPDKEIVKGGNMYQRMATLVDITEALGEKMMGGMSFKELARVFDGVGFHIAEHVTPQIIHENYFEHRKDDLKAFENVSFILAKKNRFNF